MTKILVLLIVIVIVCVIEWMREIHTFTVTHYEVQSPKLKCLKNRKIILLSDLHNYNYGYKNDKLLEAIKKEKPDFILIAGDMLVAKAGTSPDIALDFVKQLPGICDTYYANGNHEQRMKENPEKYGQTYFQYREQVINSGVHYLENSSESIVLDNKEIKIHGLEIPANCYKKFQKVTIPERCVENCLGKVDPSLFQILIAHNPVFMEEYLKWGADLIVSGHLHGGVARIPGWRGVITPQGGLFPKYSGEMTKVGDTTVVVSKGIGIHTIPIRFLNPAEIVVLHIKDAEE